MQIRPKFGDLTYTSSMSEPTEFQLHKQLRADSIRVGQLELCELRLVNDSRFHWYLLVPRIPDLTELHHLPTAHRLTLLNEIEQLSEHLLATTSASKINVATLGNIVPQLHMHVIGRSPEDPAWPNSVWASGPAETYTKADAEAAIKALREALIAS